MSQPYTADLVGLGIYTYSILERGLPFLEKYLPAIERLEFLFDCKLKVVAVPDDYKRPETIQREYRVLDATSLKHLDNLEKQMEREERERFRPFLIPKRCKRCVYRKGQTCLVPTCMKVAYVPRDYGVFKSEVS